MAFPTTGPLCGHWTPPRRPLATAVCTYPTAITQNVEFMLDSVQASSMLSNSEMVVMLNQSPRDREKLAQLLRISEDQAKYIKDVPAGHGLIKYGRVMVPFVNDFPKNTKLYELMTTRAGEGRFGRT